MIDHMNCQGRSFPDTRLTFQVGKVMGGMWMVAFRIKVSAPVPVPLDFGF